MYNYEYTKKRLQNKTILNLNEYLLILIHLNEKKN
jgi:hypothetical protein